MDIALLGTPETSLRGLSTLIALRVRRSTGSASSGFSPPSLSGVNMVTNLAKHTFITGYQSKEFSEWVASSRIVIGTEPAFISVAGNLTIY